MGPHGAEAKARSVDLRRFVLDLAAAAGGIGEPSEDGLALVALPPDAARLAGLPDYLTLAFESAAAGEDPAVELAVPGSAILDKLVALGLELGRVAVRYAVVPGVRIPPNLMERIEGRVHFERCRRPVLRATSVEARETAAFRFVVTYAADERFSDLVTVAVDAHTLADRTSLLPEMEKVYFTSDPALAPLPPMPAKHPYDEVFRAAIARLGQAAGDQYILYQTQVARYARAETAKLLSYYGRTLEDLAEREAAAMDSEKKARLRKKIAAVQTERERRLNDTVAKYRITAGARLDGVTVSVLPVVRAVLVVRHKEKDISHDVLYNLATNQAEPAACARCGKACMALYPDAEGAAFVCGPDGKCAEQSLL